MAHGQKNAESFVIDLTTPEALADKPIKPEYSAMAMNYATTQKPLSSIAAAAEAYRPGPIHFFAQKVAKAVHHDTQRHATANTLAALTCHAAANPAHQQYYKATNLAAQQFAAATTLAAQQYTEHTDPVRQQHHIPSTVARQQWGTAPNFNPQQYRPTINYAAQQYGSATSSTTRPYGAAFNLAPQQYGFVPNFTTRFGTTTTFAPHQYGTAKELAPQQYTAAAYLDHQDHVTVPSFTPRQHAPATNYVPSDQSGMARYENEKRLAFPGQPESFPNTHRGITMEDQPSPVIMGQPEFNDKLNRLTQQYGTATNNTTDERASSSDETVQEDFAAYESPSPDPAAQTYLFRGKSKKKGRRGRKHGQTASLFTAEEDQFIHRLKTAPESSWVDIHKRYNARFPHAQRSKLSIQVHYSRKVLPRILAGKASNKSTGRGAVRKFFKVVLNKDSDDDDEEEDEQDSVTEEDNARASGGYSSSSATSPPAGFSMYDTFTTSDVQFPKEHNFNTTNETRRPPSRKRKPRQTASSRVRNDGPPKPPRHQVMTRTYFHSKWEDSLAAVPVKREHKRKISDLPDTMKLVPSHEQSHTPPKRQRSKKIDSLVAEREETTWHYVNPRLIRNDETLERVFRFPGPGRVTMEASHGRSLISRWLERGEIQPFPQG